MARGKASETENKLFAQRLREIMEKRGMKPTTLSEKIRNEQSFTLQRQSISQYMYGQSNPDSERLAAICNSLNVSADFLLGLTDYETPDTDLRGVCEYTRLSENAIKNISSLSNSKIHDGEVLDLDLLNEMLSSNKLRLFLYELGLLVAEERLLKEQISEYINLDYSQVSEDDIRKMRETLNKEIENNRYRRFLSQENCIHFIESLFYIGDINRIAVNLDGMLIGRLMLYNDKYDQEEFEYNEKAIKELSDYLRAVEEKSES